MKKIFEKKFFAYELMNHFPGLHKRKFKRNDLKIICLE